MTEEATQYGLFTVRTVTVNHIVVYAIVGLVGMALFAQYGWFRAYPVVTQTHYR